MISAIPYTANPFYGDFHWKDMNHKYAGMFVCLIGRLHKIEKKVSTYPVILRFASSPGVGIGNNYQSPTTYARSRTNYSTS